MLMLSRLARANAGLRRAVPGSANRHRFLVAALAALVLPTVLAAALAGGRFVEADGWKARITVDCLLKDQVCGSFRYETQACEGDLIYSREIATGFEFRTELRAGRCLPGCVLQLSSDFKRYTEVCKDSRHDGTLVAAATTSPVGSSPPAATVSPTAPPPAAAPPAAARPTTSGRPQETKLSGVVRFKWDNGDVYDGPWLDGKRNGKGRMAWASGQTYDGEWRDDVAVGEGAMTFPNGDRYQGEVKDGIVHGRGRMQFSNGDTFEGRFEQGIPDVEGTYTEKDGSRYVGQWKNGVKQGRGKSVWASGQSYDGDWIADKPEGRGSILFANGDRYEGQVSNGQPQGKGVKVYASGDRYEGGFVQGEANGEGFYRWKNGDTYNGQWQKGKKVGAGRYRWASGDYWEGEFADDKRTESGRLYFTTAVAAASGEGARIASQADALAGTAKPGEKGLDRGKLLAIPMVAKEMRECSRKQGTDCATRVVDDVLSDKLQQHKWQTMASDKGGKGKASVFEVDTNSVLESGNVFTWLRAGDGSQARNIGIKYDCRAQALEIQLIYHCTGGATCALDPNIDKYAGKVLPATDIKGWFKEACER